MIRFPFYVRSGEDGLEQIRASLTNLGGECGIQTHEQWYQHRCAAYKIGAFSHSANSPHVKGRNTKATLSLLKP